MIRRLLDRVIDGAMILAEIAITLMMAHITVELFVRWLFRYGLDAVPEIVAIKADARALAGAGERIPVAA